MKDKDAEEIHSVLHDLWDFFISNSDSDETGLRESISPHYNTAIKAIRKELYRIRLKNNIRRELTKLRKSKSL